VVFLENSADFTWVTNYVRSGFISPARGDPTDISVFDSFVVETEWLILPLVALRFGVLDDLGGRLFTDDDFEIYCLGWISVGLSVDFSVADGLWTIALGLEGYLDFGVCGETSDGNLKLFWARTVCGLFMRSFM